ncbi:IS3 family transposase [Adlercreutzia sp. ZJ304]|uniref:IS3 family transposase n=1 Tax=Adlercreutzia sp. ZJ304 TaxID=2709791 RepID=UPI0013EA1981|nr:IS3 family transposase [Adlercreutzia sp. ZJ304]
MDASNLIDSKNDTGQPGFRGHGADAGEGCIHAQTFETREAATLEVFEYIECFYNRIRIHSTLDWLSPEDFEKKYFDEIRSEAA